MDSLEPPAKIRKKNMDAYLDADITFLVGPDKESVPAYSQFLTVSNDVFRKMLSGSFEKKTEYEIPEFNPQDYMAFLNYLYHDEIDFRNCCPRNVYKIAHQYMVKTLCQLCVTEISCKLIASEVFELLEWNSIYQEEKLGMAIEKLFSENFMQILNDHKQKCLTLPKETIVKILKWDKIYCTEDLIYEFILEWADEQIKLINEETTTENRSKILKEILPLIRLKIYEDLTFDKSSVKSRYIWPFDSEDEISLRVITSNEWAFDLNADFGGTVIGFRLPLSNIKGVDCLTEKFTFQYSAKNFKETFEYSIRESQVMRDFYLRKPLQLERGVRASCHAFKICFASIKSRLTPVLGSTPLLIPTQVKLKLFTSPPVPNPRPVANSFRFNLFSNQSPY